MTFCPLPPLSDWQAATAATTSPARAVRGIRREDGSDMRWRGLRGAESRAVYDRGAVPLPGEWAPPSGAHRGGQDHPQAAEQDQREPAREDRPDGALEAQRAGNEVHPEVGDAQQEPARDALPRLAALVPHDEGYPDEEQHEARQ